MQIGGIEVEPGLTAKDGLLYMNGAMIALPAADLMARKYGYAYAEQLAHDLEGIRPQEHGPIKPEGTKVYALLRTWRQENPSDELIRLPEAWDFSKAASDQQDLFYVNLGSNQEIIRYEGPVPDKGPVTITETRECRDTDDCSTLGVDYHRTTGTVTVYIDPDHGDYESLDIRPAEMPCTHNALIALMRAIEADNRLDLKSTPSKTPNIFKEKFDNAKKIQRRP